MLNKTFLFLLGSIAVFQCPLQAGLLEFATFGPSNLVAQSTNPVYSWVNNDNLSNPSGTFEAGNGGGPGNCATDGPGQPCAEVGFQFLSLDIPSYAVLETLPTGTLEDVSLVRSSTSVTAASCTGSCATGGDPVSQPIGAGTITFYYDDPNFGGTPEILLQITGANNVISGLINGTTANFAESSGSYTFSSFYINFADVDQTDRSVSVSTIQPSLSVNADGLLNSFSAQATGTFSAEFVAAPEPGSVWMMASALFLTGAAISIRARRSMPNRG